MTTNRDRYIMALYYAYGRSDAQQQAGERVSVGAIPFAEWYAARYDEMLNGSASFCPSVQDGWDTYRRSLAS